MALVLEPFPYAQLILRRPDHLSVILGVFPAIVEDEKDFSLQWNVSCQLIESKLSWIDKLGGEVNEPVATMSPRACGVLAVAKRGVAPTGIWGREGTMRGGRGAEGSGQIP